MRRITASAVARLGPCLGPRRALHMSRPLAVDRTTKEGDPGEIQAEEETGCCDKEDTTTTQTVVAGRVVTPELDKQGYTPEGIGLDPAEQGGHLKPGDSAGGEEYWAEPEKPHKQAPLVEDKLTGEKLRDTDVLTDRKSG